MCAKEKLGVSRTFISVSVKSEFHLIRDGLPIPTHKVRHARPKCLRGNAERSRARSRTHQGRASNNARGLCRCCVCVYVLCVGCVWVVCGLCVGCVCVCVCVVWAYVCGCVSPSSIPKRATGTCKYIEEMVNGGSTFENAKVW